MDKNLQLEYKLKTAGDFVIQGNFLHAIQLYTSIIDEHPENAEAHFQLAEIYSKTDKLESALNLLNSFLDNYPSKDDVRLYLGQLLLRNARWEQAIEVLSLIMPEENHLVAFFLGYAHFILKEYELSRINFLNYLQFKEKTELVHEANLYLAKIEIELKNYEKALEYAKKTDVIYSNFWELNLIYAVIYYNMGMFAHAVVPVEKAIKHNPKEAAAYEWGGKIYLKLGDYYKAEKLFLKYIENMDDVPSDIYTKLGEACLKTSKTKDALTYFDVALKLDPENNNAKEGKKNASDILNNNAASDG